MKERTVTFTLPERIDTSNAGAVEQELMALIQDDIPEAMVLDAENLSYISSAGLRVLMKLQKKGLEVTIANASPEVYSILEMTGFTSFIKVKRRIREINLDGLKHLGKGATGSAWKLDDEKIVKIFRGKIDPELVEREMAIAKKAFASGVPTCIPFELVKCGENYGIVYELIDSTTLLEMLVDNPQDHEIIRKYASLVKNANQIPYKTDGSKESFFKYQVLETAEKMKGVYFDEEELGKVKKLLLDLKDSETFTHGDCHPGNVMVQNGELLYIDMTTSGAGDPIEDVAAAGRVLNVYRQILSDEAYEKKYDGLRRSDAERIWKEFLSYYYEGEEEETIRRNEKLADGIAAIRILCSGIVLAESRYSPEVIAKARAIALDAAEALL